MENQPLLDEKSKVNKVKKKRMKTIHGPVGIFSLVEEIKTPKTPDKTPIKAEKNNIFGKLFVQYLAVAAGAINKAEVNTTPTD
jgi:hypothetical protein